MPGPAPLADRLNMVFSGTAVTQGTGGPLVTATGMATEMGRIAGMLHATKEEPTPLQREVSRVRRMLGVAVIVIAVVVMGAVFLAQGVDSAEEAVTVLLRGVSLAVAAVPEGLPAVLSVVLAIGVQRMAAHRAIVKKLSSVETLGSASVIGTDKTGTLTKNEMTIERVVTRVGGTRVTGVGTARRGGSSTTASRSPTARCGRRTRWCSAAAAWPAMRCCDRRTASGRCRETRPRPPFWSPSASWAPRPRGRSASVEWRRCRSPRHARTAGFTVLVFAQLFNSVNARSETTSAFHRLFVNPWLWGALALSLLLQLAVVYLPWLNQAFGTTPLTSSSGWGAPGWPASCCGFAKGASSCGGWPGDRRRRWMSERRSGGVAPGRGPAWRATSRRSSSTGAGS